MREVCFGEVIEADHVGVWAGHQVERNQLRLHPCGLQFLARLPDPEVGGDFPVVAHQQASFSAAMRISTCDLGMTM